MKKLLLFSLALCLFVVCACQKPRHENPHTKKTNYQNSNINNDLYIKKSTKEINSPLPLSAIFNQQDTNASNLSEVLFDGWTQLVVNKSSKENIEIQKSPLPYSGDANPVQETRRSGANSDKTAPKMNVTYATQNVEEVQFMIPSGITLPAAVIDSANDLSAPQVEVLDAIAEEFLDSAMATANSTNNLPPQQTLPRNWSKSLNEANERYRSLYGVDAYNAWTGHAAKEAFNDRP